MLKHDDVWRAIDSLARQYNLSPSGLARQAGLDPTTFNKSKRVTSQGKKRWPSTESIAKILAATGASLAEFVNIIGEENAGAIAQRIPSLDTLQSSKDGYFDHQGAPSEEGWDEILAPHIEDRNAFALEISGSRYEPVYRDGDLIVVSPGASIRRGDRVLIKQHGGGIMICQLVRESARRIELAQVGNSSASTALQNKDVAWMSRIIWASQ
ncbi:helix-turn-helix transcriptional regulator [Pelagibius sp. Alg239-R121]|uniref:LexA family transcriptional regulator n=1 Tax=Pelagibius sp. Alg239-R121 TaxID=2993448 RepID=UPI0024A72AE8|nr:helix-turn-helix transcriptional regulator [Pelagibius sp. Alg239-R121]